MWASSMAINGLLSGGAEVGWTVHPMEHELSAFYDITHGEGLAILTPFWMDRVLSNETAPKFAEYGVNVWGLSPSEDVMSVAKQAIQCTRDFFKQMNLPTTLREVGIDDSQLEVMAEKAAPRCAKAFVPLSKEDVLSIFKASL
jgi:alcohol dehydrogenase YqhD (iron-dependent ADH family)